MKTLIGPAREALHNRRASIAQGTSDSERRELVEIDAALERMENGRWGHCEQCGAAIGRQRLLAMPEVRHCLTCSETLELRRR